MSRLDGRTAVVTGAGRGIGLAISERLLADGARVVMVDRDAAAVEGAAKRLGSDARAIVADVTRTTDVRSRRRDGARVAPAARHRREQRRHHRPLLSDVGADGRGLAAGDRRRSHERLPRLPRRRAAHAVGAERPHREHRVHRRQGR